MNEEDLKTTKSKKAKTEKTVESKTEEISAKTQKTSGKKSVSETDSEPKVKKTAKKAVIQAEDASEKTPKKVSAKTQIKADSPASKNEKDTKKVASGSENDSSAEIQPKAKKVPAKTKKDIQVAADVESDIAEAVAIKEDNSAEEKLPRAAKIQTQEDFDLTEIKVEQEEPSPIFKELAEPKLPALREENRAFLQMQSPTRLFFYWSLKNDSYNTLRKALGSRADDYGLAIRLTNLATNHEEIHQVGNKGSWWFDRIDADSRYRAEVGFYSVGRPFVRIVFSNILETPRLKPSANTDYQPYFAVTADQFAEVLDLAGFSQDALEVYLAGDEPEFADEATQKAFVQLTGKAQIDFSDINISELRYVLFALASGLSLFDLKGQVSANLFGFLGTLTEQNPDALTEEKVILALEEFFGFSPYAESIEEETIAPTVFGASLLNFPKQLRRKTANYNPQGRINPLSSFSLK